MVLQKVKKYIKLTKALLPYFVRSLFCQKKSLIQKTGKNWKDKVKKKINNIKPLDIACPIATGDLLRLENHAPSSPSFTSPNGVSSVLKKEEKRVWLNLYILIKVYNQIMKDKK